MHNIFLNNKANLLVHNPHIVGSQSQLLESYPHYYSPEITPFQCHGCIFYISDLFILVSRQHKFLSVIYTTLEEDALCHDTHQQYTVTSIPMNLTPQKYIPSVHSYMKGACVFMEITPREYDLLDKVLDVLFQVNQVHVQFVFQVYIHKQLFLDNNSN